MVYFHVAGHILLTTNTFSVLLGVQQKSGIYSVTFADHANFLVCTLKCAFLVILVYDLTRSSKDKGNLLLAVDFDDGSGRQIGGSISLVPQTPIQISEGKGVWQHRVQRVVTDSGMWRVQSDRP